MSLVEVGGSDRLGAEEPVGWAFQEGNNFFIVMAVETKLLVGVFFARISDDVRIEFSDPALSGV